MIIINQDNLNIYSKEVLPRSNIRRKTLKKLILLIALVILFGYIYIDLNFTRVEYVDIESNKIHGADTLKILQISDFHSAKSTIIRNRILSSIKGLKPDIIVLTGDIIDSFPKNLESVYNFIKDIIDINPNVYFVSGNHEWRSGHNIRFTKGLESIGVTILNNTNRVIKTGDTLINLCGIDDYSNKSYSMGSAFNNIDSRNFTVLLSHEPDIVLDYKDIPADLILSGHTHGGQVRIPFVGALIAPGQGLFPKYDKGLYKLDNGSFLYIDSGVGTSTFPIRFCDRSQISLITIKKS